MKINGAYSRRFGVKEPRHSEKPSQTKTATFIGTCVAGHGYNNTLIKRTSEMLDARMSSGARSKKKEKRENKTDQEHTQTQPPAPIRNLRFLLKNQQPVAAAIEVRGKHSLVSFPRENSSNENKIIKK